MLALGALRQPHHSDTAANDGEDLREALFVETAMGGPRPRLFSDPLEKRMYFLGLMVI